VNYKIQQASRKWKGRCFQYMKSTQDENRDLYIDDHLINL
jgi:hypothetical protein